MKKAIENLRAVSGILDNLVDGCEDDETSIMAKGMVMEAIEILQSPRWYSPEQWEKRTGKPWPDYWAVYYRTRYRPSIYDSEMWTMWCVSKYKTAKKKTAAQIVCATEAGPPPEDWEPEEGE
jgi:hypothetical protein